MKASPFRSLVLRLVAMLVPLAALFLAGCGRYGTLYGTVSYHGKPVPKATITFLCSTGGVVSTNCDADGNYRVSKVPLGKARVSVHNMTQIMPLMMGKMMGKQKDAGGKDAGKDSKAGIAEMMRQLGAADGTKNLMLLPEKANSPEVSGIAVEVSGGSQEFNVELVDY
jgi:hypothetical protein